MPWLLSLALIACSLGCLVLSAWWCVGVWRVMRVGRAVPTLGAPRRPTTTEPGRMPSVRVVVPAHNEETRISGLVACLRAQTHPRMHVLLALDRCTDRTEPLARAAIGDDPRFEVIHVSACPQGWAGKVHAVWSALERSTLPAADLLVFLDADTSPGPECVAAAAAMLDARGLDLLSVLSTLSTRRWYERLAQPAACMELAHVTKLSRPPAGPGRPPRPLASGQCMLFRREAHETLGGHAAVRGSLLEDLALARLAHALGLRVGVAFSGGLLPCAMYDSWPRFRDGWQRIFAEAAARRPDRLARWAWRVRVFHSLLPGLGLATIAASLAASRAAPIWAWAPALLLGTLGTAAWFACVARACRLSGAPASAAAWYPLGAWLVADILAGARRRLLRGERFAWGGMDYILTPAPRPAPLLGTGTAPA